MQQVIGRTRSDDASHLRSIISSHAVPHPDKKLVDPPVGAKGSKGRLGFNHPELARLLCPTRSLRGLLEDSAEYVSHFMNGGILVTAQKWPAVLYSGEIAGDNYNPEKSDEGFL
ncbi:hypothetical protein PISMIDRAFT_123239 [Pisolithus microcarpus 441]|uniref:Uncharacterized protein n=1 Tax=Pisolithus microcarpus 441 TaxID=765257 RepID=A0A0C9YTB0_9AGAM|nr:hypothetical protein PISMIDRAFT_123239 [Pisolithus microcarpus 441]